MQARSGLKCMYFQSQEKRKLFKLSYLFTLHSIFVPFSSTVISYQRLIDPLMYTIAYCQNLGLILINILEEPNVMEYIVPLKHELKNP